MAVDYDVIVVGAGLSGLSSAKLLKDHGYRVLVLEAADRVGGRLYTKQNDKVGYVDVGGAYIGPTQDRVFRLAKDFGIKTYHVFDKGDTVYFRKGRRKLFSGLIPPLGSVASFMDAVHIFKKIDQLAEKISLREPWASPDAEELDQQTLQQWYNRHITTGAAMDDARFLSRINLTAEPYEVSLLWALWYIKAGGGVKRINSTEGGAQERKFIGGSQQLTEKLAENIGSHSVLLNRPVTTVTQSEGCVEVMTGDDNTYQSNYVILAMAPAVQEKIKFSPPLPAERNQLIQRVPMGSVIKTMTYYDRPYWREKGMNGVMFIEDDSPEFLVQATMDDTKPDGSRPCIMGFVMTHKVQESGLTSEFDRKRAIAQSYAKIFECPEMAKPVHYEEKNWAADPWVGGCYTGIMGPGTLTRFGKYLREPIGRILFAGTETATIWTGYMEGAIEAGERAAREVMHKEGRITKEEIFKDEPRTEGVDVPDLTPPLLHRFMPSVHTLYSALAAVALVGFVTSRL